MKETLECFVVAVQKKGDSVRIKMKRGRDYTYEVPGDDSFFYFETKFTEGPLSHITVGRCVTLTLDDELDEE